MNRCISKNNLKNEFCFGQKTKADKILKKYKKDTLDKSLLNIWFKILKRIKNTSEYNPNWNYGLYQIDKDINIKIGSGTFNKKNEEVMIPKYRDLDEKIHSLKEELKIYYDKELKPKLFKYELLK